MNRTNNSNLTPYAKRLRSEMTKEERRLWYDFLKPLPQTFHRQKVIGPYIVDFYCAAAKLVIELDGSQHYDEAGAAADRERDQWLRSQGLTVVRYSNSDVQTDFSGVCEDILRLLATSSVTAAAVPASPQGEA